MAILKPLIVQIGQQLRRWFRDTWIVLRQRLYLHRRRAGQNRRIIVFLVPSRDLVNGGVRSIISLADESEKLRAIHGADVFVANAPGTSRLLRYTKFKNTRTLVSLDLLLNLVPPGAELLVHIPELYVKNVVQHEATTFARLKGVNKRFNIMLQNIDLMPKPTDVAQLRSYGITTCTTAHRAYGNEQTALLIGCPVHHLSVGVCAAQYNRVPYVNKSNLIILSPDQHPARDQILKDLKAALPQYEFRVVWNLTFEQYKELIARAKFSLTFGEGLDGYFVETIFSGGIGCAVYNDRFFTPDLRKLPFVYPSWDALVRQLPNDIVQADIEDNFKKIQATQFDPLANEYAIERFRTNLAQFYRDHFPVEVPASGGTSK